jgi:antitoxin FitA
MAQLIVRSIENVVKAGLQRQARQNGRSMEDEIRDILCHAAEEEALLPGGLGTEIAGMFSKRSDSQGRFLNYGAPAKN